MVKAHIWEEVGQRRALGSEELKVRLWQGRGCLGLLSMGLLAVGLLQEWLRQLLGCGVRGRWGYLGLSVCRQEGKWVLL